MEVIRDQKAYRNILLFLNKPKGKEVMAYLLSAALGSDNCDFPSAISEVIAKTHSVSPEISLDFLRGKRDHRV